jgi:hypothetical protein
MMLAGLSLGLFAATVLIIVVAWPLRRSRRWEEDWEWPSERGLH